MQAELSGDGCLVEVDDVRRQGDNGSGRLTRMKGNLYHGIRLRYIEPGSIEQSWVRVYGDGDARVGQRLTWTFDGHVNEPPFGEER